MTKRYELSEAATALWLADRAAEDGDTVFLVRGAARLERLARACAGFCAGRAELLVLPPWDVLPFDQAAPSPGVIGRRVETLSRLAAGRTACPRLVLVSAGSSLLRVPPAGRWDGGRLDFRAGDAVYRDALRTALTERGYHLCELVHDRGDAAVHGHVVDVHPAGSALAVRMTVHEDRITGLHHMDPVTQRSLGAVDHLSVFPAREVADGSSLPSGPLVPVFDYLAGFRLFVDDGVTERWAELREQIADAHENRRRVRRSGVEGGGPLPTPDALYLTPEEAMACVAGGSVATPGGRAEPAPRRVADLVALAAGSSVPVVVAAPTDVAKLARSLSKRGVAARAATDWPDAVAGGVTCWALEIDGGFRTDGIVVVQAGHLLRASAAENGGLTALLAGQGLRIGDVVVHAEHGAARLTGLKPVTTGGTRAERLALSFAGDAELLVDPLELDRIWRYGAAGTLDHLGGAAWHGKRSAIEQEIHGVAGQLAAAAAARNKRRAPILVPDREGYERVSLRFPHALSGDQRAAVDAVLADLRRGSPMNRLVCGDVGFGKTEVALRAMAAVALAGHQVALVAPTSVLAQQHLDTVRRRFAGTGVRVEGLIGGTDAAPVRAGLADGSIGVVVGTQALAGPEVRFLRLGLVVVDEEQRLGEAQKQALMDRGGAEEAVHSLVMTATPIPRTMQAAMLGLRDVSVIATAPANRQPTRTLVQPFGSELVRDVLLREKARGGQSFVVCPRISDLHGLAAQLAELAPGLDVVIAHGRMGPDALDQAVGGFAAGHGDVLLATNIIEAGLDIPRANTILVMHPDRFGLAQLHQIRGRVGRGARRGTAYLLTDPGRQLSAETMARLRVLEGMASLGSGIAISGADLDRRGAGELFGEVQAGHVSVLGTELYQHLLLRAVRAGRGESVSGVPPVLHVGMSGLIPDSYVADPEVRLSLYRRLARLEEIETVDAFGEELTDRFGPHPEEVDALLAVARLRCLGVAAGIRHLEAGPRGVSIQLHNGETPLHLAMRLAEMAEKLGGTIRDDRLVVAMPHAPPHRRLGELIALLAR